MSSIITEDKPSIQGAAKEGKRERRFELSLPALVTGVDVLEKKFREKTFLLAISAEEATLWLKSKVAIGSKLNLFLDIPKTFVLGENLKIALSGTVYLAQINTMASGKKQIVSVRLDKKYKIHSHLS